MLRTYNQIVLFYIGTNLNIITVESLSAFDPQIEHLSSIIPLNQSLFPTWMTSLALQIVSHMLMTIHSRTLEDKLSE